MGMEEDGFAFLRKSESVRKAEKRHTEGVFQ